MIVSNCSLTLSIAVSFSSISISCCTVGTTLRSRATRRVSESSSPSHPEPSAICVGAAPAPPSAFVLKWQEPRHFSPRLPWLQQPY
eukprot:385830-Pleurochrysis_carterae.AAC.6